MNNTSPIVSFFINEGVPRETIELLLILPIIATLIAFLRQIVGIKAFGIYTPSFVIFAFLAIGIKYGILLFTSVVVVGMLTRFLLKKIRILYLPRVAITVSIVALAILGILVFGGLQQRTGLASVSIFPLLIMIAIVEKFVAAQIEKGSKTAVILAVETLIISLIGYFVASQPFLAKIVMAYPWIILFTIPVNVMLGRWTGLRLIEYFRFREVLRKM